MQGIGLACVRLKYEIRKWSRHHVIAFALTYLIYAFLHACRKSFSNIKNVMEKSLTPVNDSLYPYHLWQKEQMFEGTSDATVFLGELDFLFLLAYAIGLYVSGYIGDRVNLRYMLTVGMCGSALMTFAFGYLSVKFQVRHKNYFRIIYFLNGLFQSTGWPITVTIIGNWFSKSSAGLVFGFWSTNQSFGNIIGSLIVIAVVDYGYEYGVLLNSLLLFCGAVVVFFCLIPHPNHIGLLSPDRVPESCPTSQVEVVPTFIIEEEALGGNSDSDTDSLQEYDTTVLFTGNRQKKAVGFFQAWLIPGVILYALSFACLKLVNYSFLFWLPTYLTQNQHWDDKSSDRLSNFYDIGLLCGGVAAGITTDLLGRRSPLIGLMLLLSLASVYMYHYLGITYVANAWLMFIMGLLIGGPANIIPTAITTDLGKQRTITYSAAALATITGIIDGTGSVGAAVGQYLVGVILRYGGWEWVFHFMAIFIALSIFSILPILVKELKLDTSKSVVVYSELDDVDL